VQRAVMVRIFTSLFFIHLIFPLQQRKSTNGFDNNHIFWPCLKLCIVML
jgi:hypothetical protein